MQADSGIAVVINDAAEDIKTNRAHGSSLQIIPQPLYLNGPDRVGLEQTSGTGTNEWCWW